MRESGAHGFTDRYLVTLNRGGTDSALDKLYRLSGITRPTTFSSQDVISAAEALNKDNNVLLDELGVAIISPSPDQVESVLSVALELPGLVRVERERTVQACGTSEYLTGYRDGVGDAVERATGTPGLQQTVADTTPVWNESVETWGVQAVIGGSTLTGTDVGIAVLDTGIDHRHPDLAPRINKVVSFVSGSPVDDMHGHGTHCIGTACGPARPARGPRYGVAPETLINSAKVLDDSGYGVDGDVLLGMGWAALQDDIRVISMSLAKQASRGDAYSPAYERAAQLALSNGKLVVAAAGNDSRRPDKEFPVGHPANCPSILAVGALTPTFGVASFSNGNMTGSIGNIAVAAPGVDVFSADVNGEYRRWSGTSMAAPHVAGVAALLWGSRPTSSPQQVRDLLIAHCQRLPWSPTDVGAGMVRAPID